MKLTTLVHSFLGMLCLCLSLTSHSAPLSDEALANDVLVYINQYRTHHGLKALRMDPTISREAERHSQAMARHALPFGHQGFATRLVHLRNRIPDAGGGAENVAYNYKTARVVVDGWINSPGHRRNLMGRYDLTGIGIARDAQGRPYYTQLFLQKGKTPVMARHQRRSSSLAMLQHIRHWYR